MTSTSERSRLTRELKAEAARLGFDGCGVSEARRLDDEAARLENWLHQGMHGTMGWMERNFEKRIDPTRLVEGARSVVSVIESYYQPIEHSKAENAAHISRYAWGEDYHHVLKEKLFALYNWLDERVGGIGGRAFTDSAPVMDKAWAQRSGLGWIGKHTNVLNRQIGSYFFIGELIIDIELDADSPGQDFCGSCTRCIEACPTDAIYQPYAVDARRCISYLTIENRDHVIAEAFEPLLENWVFGCDICQQVCPWNKFKRVTREERYLPRAGMVNTTLDEYEEIDIEEFRERFRRTPVKRARYEGFLRNVRAARRHATVSDDDPDVQEAR
jgi:epoxyqueuosine reductase